MRFVGGLGLFASGLWLFAGCLWTFAYSLCWFAGSLWLCLWIVIDCACLWWFLVVCGCCLFQ